MAQQAQPAQDVGSNSDLVQRGNRPTGSGSRTVRRNPGRAGSCIGHRRKAPGSGQFRTGSAAGPAAEQTPAAASPNRRRPGPRSRSQSAAEAPDAGQRHHLEEEADSKAESRHIKALDDLPRPHATSDGEVPQGTGGHPPAHLIAPPVRARPHPKHQGRRLTQNQSSTPPDHPERRRSSGGVSQLPQPTGITGPTRPPRACSPHPHPHQPERRHPSGVRHTPTRPPRRPPPVRFAIPHPSVSPSPPVRFAVSHRPFRRPGRP